MKVVKVGGFDYHVESSTTPNVFYRVWVEMVEGGMIVRCAHTAKYGYNYTVRNVKGEEAKTNPCKHMVAVAEKITEELVVSPHQP